MIEVRPDGTTRKLNWQELADGAVRVAAALLELGVAPGEPIAYQLPNVLDFVTLSLGILRIGAICEPLMPIFREHELEFMLRASRASVLIVPEYFHGHDHAAMAGELQERLETLEYVFVLSSEEKLGVNADLFAGTDSFASVGMGAYGPDMSAEIAQRLPDPGALAQLLFTSGSTGEPKGVLHRQDVLTRAAQMHIRHFGLGPDDVIYVPSPLAHQTGFLYGMWIALLLGVPQVIQTVWDAEVGFDVLSSTGATFVQAATPFLADLVRVARERGRTPGALRTFVATGAAIPRELAREARAALGAEVGGAWGSTESCLGTAFAPGDSPERASGSDGRALDGVNLRIVDDAGAPVPAGTEGNFELLVPTLFEGYLNRPELTTAAVTPDGYYRTGDLARIDAEGYLRLTGRVKDVINRGGEKVPVTEVEQALYAHPAVREVAVVAMPDQRLGERACAFVVLEPGAELGFEAMQQHLDQQRMAKPYWPERLEIVDALPHTPSGKIQKFVLREHVRTLIEKKAVTG